jgi:hypothetical protein
MHHHNLSLQKSNSNVTTVTHKPIYVLLSSIICFSSILYVCYLTWTCIEKIDYILFWDKYDKLKNGKYTFECSIGGSAIQVAECQIFQGFNIFLVYLVTNLLQYTSQLFRSSNIIEIIGTSIGLFVMFKSAIVIPFKILFGSMENIIIYYFYTIVFIFHKSDTLIRNLLKE